MAICVERDFILQNIYDHFIQVQQWVPSDFDLAMKYEERAAALIELLETKDCGSVGGFDDDNPVQNESGYRLFDRFLCLLRKHNTKVEGDVKWLTDYFSILNDLGNAVGKSLNLKKLKKSLCERR